MKETEPSYNEYINGEHGIVRSWLKAGSSGWRLDVADELPDEFLDRLTAAAKAETPDALVLARFGRTPPIRPPTMSAAGTYWGASWTP